MQREINDNSPRAYYNLNTNTSQTLIKESSSTKAVDNGSSWQQRSSGARPLGTGRRFKLSWELCVGHRKIQDSASKHRGLARFGSFSTVYSLSRLALSCRGGGGFSDRLSSRFWTSASPNHAQNATAALNEIFKNCQKFVDHRMPLQSISNHFKSKKLLSVLPLI